MSSTVVHASLSEDKYLMCTSAICSRSQWARQSYMYCVSVSPAVEVPVSMDA